MPLKDVTLENGAMRTIVGSHKWGLIKDSATFFEKGIAEIRILVSLTNRDEDMDGLKEKFASIATGPWEDEPCVMKVLEGFNLISNYWLRRDMSYSITHSRFMDRALIARMNLV